MKNTILTGLTALLSYSITVAQAIHSPITFYYPSSGSYSKNFQDAFSLLSNVAASANFQNFQVGVYGEKKFMLAETSQYSAVISAPVYSGSFSLETDYFGFSDYAESQIGLGYALPVSPQIDVGVKFNYYQVRIPAYHNASAVNFELGALLHINEQLHAGVSVYNPMNSPLGKNTGERIASVYKTGIGYEWSSSFFTQLEILKEKNKDADVHLAIQYKPLEQFFGRAGIYTESSVTYFGLGYLYHRLRMDICISLHQQLGLSPGLLLFYQFTRRSGK